MLACVSSQVCSLPLVVSIQNDHLSLVAGAGYIILIASRNAALSYVAVYLAAWSVISICYISIQL
jgi:hypothetical protein